MSCANLGDINDKNATYSYDDFGFWFTFFGAVISLFGHGFFICSISFDIL